MKDLFYVSHFFIDNFIEEHDLKVYDKSFLDDVSTHYSYVRIYMDNVYLYIYPYDGEYRLVIETFPHRYELYILKWVGDEKYFIDIINSIGIINIKNGPNYPIINYEGEREILETILKSMIDNRKFVTSKYKLI
jgi:hypothetical protein